ncbi:MAG TPA: Rv3654c family TadE-like protein [Candidatus Limnocylindrales bacterium]|nr:Rv3654c family TadE-like protein [Candidatus Limnocylindrales bacterium]
MTAPGTRRRSLARCFEQAQRDKGSASLFGVSAGIAVVLAGSSIALSAAYLIARAEARSAADLAVLAGARWTRAGQNVACARAEQMVTANHAVTVSCVVEGLDIELTVEVKGVRAVARAGPVRTTGGSDAA